MASLRIRLILRLVFMVLYLLLIFNASRPFFRKMYATFQDIRDRRQTFHGGMSEIMNEAKKSMGWVQDGSPAPSRRNVEKRGGGGRRQDALRSS